MTPELVVGALATVLTTAFSWPQAVRALRAPDVHGIAPLTALLVLFTGVSWTTFGVMIWDAPMIIANSLASLAASVTVTVLLTRGRLRPLTFAAAAAGYAALLMLAVAILGEDGAGWVGAALGASMAIPQTVRVMRGDIAGVSLAMYVLISAMVTAWFVYGLLIDEFVAMLANVFAAPTVFLCTTRLALERAKARGKRAALVGVEAAD